MRASSALVVLSDVAALALDGIARVSNQREDPSSPLEQGRVASRHDRIPPVRVEPSSPLFSAVDASPFDVARDAAWRCSSTTWTRPSAVPRHSVKAMFSRSAGVEAFARHPRLPKVPPLGKVAPPGGDPMMTAYVVMHVLRFHRDMPGYQAAQARKGVGDRKPTRLLSGRTIYPTPRWMRSGRSRCPQEVRSGIPR
jgi:hypothetical protein